MGGLRRYGSILRLFDEERPEWTVLDLAAQTSVPASTVYRTVRELVAEEFLEPAAEARYRLGACFIAFDRLVRVTDPLYRVGTALLRDVAAQARVPCTAVLARLYADKVMCVADCRSSEGSVLSSFERGRPHALTLGATSKVILAQLPARRLTKLLGPEADSRPAAPFAQSGAEIREELLRIRERGYAITRGEVDKGLVGIAAPVSAPERALIGSLSLVVPASALDPAMERRLVLLVVASASLLTEELKPKASTPERRARAAR